MRTEYDFSKGKRGALIPTKGKTRITIYIDDASRTAKDFFCPTCGILPFRRPSDPTPEEIAEGSKPFDGWAVNVRCLEGVDIESIPVKKMYGSRIKHRT